MRGSRIAKEIWEEQEYEREMKLKYSKGKYRMNSEKCMTRECKVCNNEKNCFINQIIDESKIKKIELRNKQDYKSRYKQALITFLNEKGYKDAVYTKDYIDRLQMQLKDKGKVLLEHPNKDIPKIINNNYVMYKQVPIFKIEEYKER